MRYSSIEFPHAERSVEIVDVQIQILHAAVEIEVLAHRPGRRKSRRREGARRGPPFVHVHLLGRHLGLGVDLHRGDSQRCGELELLAVPE
jgi:hypothetical protein